jgi:two-component system sensor histidine kinase/response regulator
VLGAWLWDNGLGFGLATEIDEEEALVPYRTTRTIVLVVLGMTFFLSVLLTAISQWMGKRANAILVESRDELEERVNERTIELKEQEAALWDLYENSPVAYASIGLDSNGINRHNKSFAELLGYERIDFRELIMEQLFPQDEEGVSTMQSILDHARRGSAVSDMESILLDKDGRLINVSVSTSPVSHSDGNQVEVRAAFLDITDRKQAEFALGEAKEAAESRSVQLQEEVGVRKKTEEELKRNMDALERFSNMAVDREIEMIRLKEKINDLLVQSGQESKYKIVDKEDVV